MATVLNFAEGKWFCDRRKLSDSPDLLYLISCVKCLVPVQPTALDRTLYTLGRCSLSTRGGGARLAFLGTRPAVRTYPCRCPARCRSASARGAGCCWWTPWPSGSRWPRKTGVAPLGRPLRSRRQTGDMRTRRTGRSRGMKCVANGPAPHGRRVTIGQSRETWVYSAKCLQIYSPFGMCPDT